MSFERNDGQTDEQVKFLSRGRGYTMFLTPTEAVLALRNREATPEETAPDTSRLTPHASRPMQQSVVRMKLEGANAHPTISGADKLEGIVNYFIGSDPAKWRTNVPTYKKVEYKDVYPGIDLAYYGNQGKLEYDLIVAPGADPNQIKLAFEGAEKIEVDPASGDLVLTLASSKQRIANSQQTVSSESELLATSYSLPATRGSELLAASYPLPATLRLQKPLVYQVGENGHKTLIAGNYVLAPTSNLEPRTVGFVVASYDATKPLVIDPVLFWSTYLGGTADESADQIAVDKAGNAYITGETLSSNFPITAGVYDTTANGSKDIFVSKLNATGSALLFSTFIGGSADDRGLGIATDAAGNAYVTGQTLSANFPITAGAFDNTVGFDDAFVTKLNATGSALVYSTYLGGATSSDLGNGIAVDAAGNAYVIGQTFATDFPTTAGAPDTTINRWEAFVTKLNADASALVYSTALGGSEAGGIGDDWGTGIAVDTAGNAYVTGTTDTTNFPVVNALQPAFGGGGNDAFVAKLNATGTAFVYSTYLGGSGLDGGLGIAVDAAGNAYVTGTTETPGSGFPGTAGSLIQSTFGGSGIGDDDAFVTKLNATGTAFVYSTYLGGSGNDHGFGIAVDAAGNAYVTGVTSMGSGFPGMAGSPIQSTFGGGADDAFVTKLNAAGTALVYSTYLGGAGDDAGNGIAVDAAGNAYVTGLTTTTGSGFPGTAGSSIQSALAGGDDAFVAKICNDPPPGTTPGTWVATTGDLVNGFAGGQAVVLASGPNAGKVLLAANGVVGMSSIASAQLYDPASGTWANTGTPSQIRKSHTTTLLPNGKVLLAAGYPPTGGFWNTADLYDPVTGTWSLTPNLATARGDHTATLLPNGKVLVAGGNFNSTGTQSTELYDPQAGPTGTWSSTGNLITGRWAHSATRLANGKVLVAGGVTGVGGLTATAELYTFDPQTSTGAWSSTNPLITGRQSHTATLLPNGQVLVVGGDDAASTVFASAELYTFDPQTSTGAWSSTGPMTTARSGHTAILLPNGKVLVVGGTDGSTVLASAELYDPATGTWSSTGSLATARRSFAATLLPTGQVLVAAGNDSPTTTFFTSAELYTPVLCGPEITAFSDTVVGAGGTITITGSGFGATQGSGTVTIGGQTATIQSWSDTTIVATVPAGTEGANVPIVVTVNGQSSNVGTLTVLAALTSIDVTPTTPSIDIGQTQQFTTTATYSDNSTQTLSSTGAPQFLSETFYGDATNQDFYLNAGFITDGESLYLAGSDNNRGLLLRYGLPPTAPMWTSTQTAYSQFSGLTAIGSTLYAVGSAAPPVCGASDGSGGSEAKTILGRYTTAGTLLNCRSQNFSSYRGTELFGGGAITTTESGTPYVYAIGSGEQSGGFYQVMLAKYNSTSTLLWKGRFGAGSSGAGGMTALNGFLYVAGSDSSAKPTLWKIDAASQAADNPENPNETGTRTLTPTWTRYFTAAASGVANGVTDDGSNLYVVGHRGSGPFGGNDVFVQKYDQAGNVLWTQEWGGASSDIAYRATVAGGRVYVVGETSSFGSGGQDAFILELNAATGTVVSSTYWGGAANDFAREVLVAGTELYILGQTASFGAGGTDLALLRYAIPGRITWTSSNSTVAAINQSGLATAAAQGTSTISAKCKSLTGSEGGTPQTCTEPTGLVSWWPGDGNANDITSTNDGTLQNGATFATGKVGQAFSFDGTDDYVNIPDSPTLDITDALTVETWAKVNALSTVNSAALISKLGAQTSERSYGLRLNTDGTVVFFTSSTSGGGAGITAPAIPLNQWVHIAAVKDAGATSARIYVNGALTMSGTVQHPIYNSTAPVTIGADHPFQGIRDFLNGLIDEAAIYNRALTAEEIQGIYDAGNITHNVATLTVGAPTIDSVFPASAQAGSAITITGSNFGATQGTSTVTIGGMLATVLSWSDTEIVATVPAGAEGTNKVVEVSVGGTPSNQPTLASITAGIASLAISPTNPTIAVGQTQPFTVTATMTDSTQQIITIPQPYGIKILAGAQRTVSIDPATGSETPIDPVLSAFVGSSAGPSALDVQGRRAYVIIGGNIITVDTVNDVVLATNPLPTLVSSLEFDPGIGPSGTLFGVALWDHDSNAGTPRQNLLVAIGRDLNGTAAGTITPLGTGASGFPEMSAGVSAIDPAGHRYFVTLANSLVSFDTQTGAATATALAETPSSMEYDSGENRLFGMALMSGANKLVEIIPGTGQVNVLSASPLPGPTNVSAGIATLDPANNRYYVSFAGQFHTVDTVSGNVLSSTPFDGVSSLLFHPLLTSSNLAVATVSQNPSATGVSPGSSTITATVGDSEATTLVTVTAAADLEIAKVDAPDPVSVGGALTYTITVTNNGASDATNVQVSDTLPTGVTFNAAGSSPSCAGTTTITCTVGNLANGANAILTIAVTAPASPVLLTNTAAVSATESDPTPGNNTATAQTVVRSASPQADLAVIITDTPDPVTASPAQPFTYAVTVANQGGDVATGVTLTATLSGAAGFTAPLPAGCSGTNPVTCTVDIVDINGSATRNLTVTPTAPGLVTLTATAAGDGSTADPIVTNNTSIAETTSVVAARFTVNKPDDVNDGTCDATHCSLREAINAANATADPDLIDFNITGAGPHTIAPTAVLPSIQAPVVIDGYTQPGASPNTLAVGNNAVLKIEINGSGAGAGVNGLFIREGFSTVRGLVINRYGANAIVLQAKGGNVVEGNFLGTDVRGGAGLGNSANGVLIQESSGNRIGGLSPASRNLLSGNSNTGVSIFLAPATGNTVLNNYIGTNWDGTAAIPNANGIGLSSSVSENVIGGTAPGSRNLISGNTFRGVQIQSGARRNRVEGNFIGTLATGASALPNSVGLEITAPGNTVGGTSAAARNVISGNTTHGVFIFGSTATDNTVHGNFIGTNAAGTTAIANNDGVLINGASNNTIGGTAAGARNVISGNSAHAVEMLGSTTSGNFVQGNFIGTNAAGTAAVANGQQAVLIDSAPNNTIGGTAVGAGNVISGNNDSGLQISGTSATGNQVQGNYIGTNAAGTAAMANGINGVTVGASNNTIGGTTPAARNIISGNTQNGVFISGPGAFGNLVQGNYIGTNAAGTAAIANFEGLRIDGAPTNTVGGIAAGAGNVISGNSQQGIRVTGASANGNIIQGNFIGTNVAGTGAIANSYGVWIEQAANNTIGGTAAGARNVISGNVTGVYLAGSGSTGNLIQGNYIGTNATGTAALGNSDGIDLFSSASNNFIGGTTVGAGNVISGNFAIGVRLETGASANFVQGNSIGTDAAGTTALANQFNGIVIRAPSNTIGGSDSNARNVISGNNPNGVLVEGSTATGNIIQGNYIGTNASGTAALANNNSGVVIQAAATNTLVGGTETEAGNVISGNGAHGVVITASTGNQIQGNFIGTNAAGTAALANAANGVFVSAATNTIGGTATAARNVVSGNTLNGILITGAGASGNQVQGNFIGTNAAGNAALANSGSGIFITLGATNNTVGGTVAGARNVISGNTGSGVEVADSGTSGNLIQGNFIGTKAGGTEALGNVVHGVSLIAGASNTTITGNVISGNTGLGIAINTPVTQTLVQGNFIGTNAANTPLGNGAGGMAIDASNTTIGGVAAGEGNKIAFNVGDGIGIFAPGTGNAVLGNSIYSNDSSGCTTRCLGIDLFAADGVTANDLGDSDTGGNNLQNFPVLTSVTAGLSTTIIGSLNSTPNTTFRVEYFSNTSCDASGNGEGQTFLGFANVTTDGSGNASFSATTGIVPAGQVVTATATNTTTNDTSEFSQCRLINYAPVAVNDTAPVLAGSGQSPVNVLNNDFDPDKLIQPFNAGLTITAVTQGAKGAVAIAGSGTSVTYAPNAGESGSDSFSYTVSDGSLTAVGTVNVTITAVSHLLTVTVTGPGGATGPVGTVTAAVGGSPAGISCTAQGGDCSETYPAGTNVTLTAAAEPGFLFGGWSGGGCSGIGPCTVSMTAPQVVTASFVKQVFLLAVTPAGLGTGTVTGTVGGNLAGITCGTDCQETYLPGTMVMLTATANPGSLFAGWSGACTGTGSCTVTLDAAGLVQANFSLAGTDSDGDGLPDDWEIDAVFTNPLDPDTDDDGVPDGPDTCKLTPSADNQLDSDGDSQNGRFNLGDACDPDDDNDGIADGATDPDGTGPIVAGPDNCPLLYNASQADLDVDGVGDVCDPDQDGDTYVDVNRGGTDCDDRNPAIFPGSGDECLAVGEAPRTKGGDTSDPALTDTDNDGLSDAQEDSLGTNKNDPDTDDDTILDGPDNCKLLANQDQLNADGDDLGDACDTDDDADGVLDTADNCPLTPNADQANLDASTGDTLGDACDPDQDGDGHAAVAAGGDDCNDRDGTIFPGNQEIRDDGKDNDCNPATPDTDFALVVTLTDPDDTAATLATWLPRDQRQATLTAKVFGETGELLVPITFTVEAVTAHPGRYTNDASTDTSSDYTSASCPGGLAGCVVNSASLPLKAEDFGGSVTLRVRAEVSPTQTLEQLVTVPPDQDRDGLPDVWESQYGDLAATGDIDTSHANTQLGDGLSNFKEYRGVKWQKLAPQAPRAAVYTTDALVPAGTVEHFRTDPTRKDLFVEYTGYDNSAGSTCRCPFALGTAFANVRIDVHALANGTSPDPGRRNLDVVPVRLEAQSNPSPYHLFPGGVRNWSPATLGSSGIGGTTYGSSKLLKSSWEQYFTDKPYMESAGLGTPEKLDPTSDASVEDKNDNAVLDGKGPNAEDKNGDGIIDGDHYVSLQFEHKLSPVNIDADDLIENPVRNIDPSTVNPAGEYSREQVLKHVTTHELGHAVGVPSENEKPSEDSTDVMYKYSVDWKRDGRFGDVAINQGIASAAELKIHNTSLQTP